MKKRWTLICLAALMVGGVAALYGLSVNDAAIELPRKCSVDGITNIRPGTESTPQDADAGWVPEPEFCDYWYWKATGEPVHIEDFFGDGDGYLEACEFVNLEGWWYHITFVDEDCIQLEHLF